MDLINKSKTNPKENSSDVLNDIQYLQSIEQELFNNLETNTTLTTKQKKEIIDKINNLSKMRMNLYSTLNNVNSYYRVSLDNSRYTLGQQSAAVKIVEEELNKVKQRFRVVEEEKNNKIRLIEINNYYGDKYYEHTELMKILIFALVIIIILTFLHNKGFLFNNLYYFLMFITIFITIILIWNKVSSIITRDNMVYQEYDWNFDQSIAPKSSGEIKDPWFSSELEIPSIGSCVGKLCCSEGLVYDNSKNKCVVPYNKK